MTFKYTNFMLKFITFMLLQNEHSRSQFSTFSRAYKPYAGGGGGGGVGWLCTLFEYVKCRKTARLVKSLQYIVQVLKSS